MSVSTPAPRRPTFRPPGLLAALGTGLLMACSNNAGGDDEGPADVRTQYAYGPGALDEWWAQAATVRRFDFLVSNGGTPARNVQITATLGPNLSLVSMQCLNAGVPCAGSSTGANTFTLDSVGGSDDIRVVLQVAEQNPQSFQAQVTLKADLPGDATPWNNADIGLHAVRLADRSVSLSAPATAAAGSEVDVELTIANQGPDFFYETRRLTLPDGVVGEELACTMTDGAGCTTATLDHSDVGVRANVAAVLRYRLRVPAGYHGPLTISKTVRSDGDTNPANNGASAAIQVGPPGTP